MILIAAIAALGLAAHDPVPGKIVSGPPAPVLVQPAETRAPMIGLDGSDADGCSGVGRVGGYPDGATLRMGPADDAAEAETLPPRSLVWLCEAAGDWQGVVYASGEFQNLEDCQVGSPVTEPEPYSGPCKHGWVKARSVQFLAG